MKGKFLCQLLFKITVFCICVYSQTQSQSTIYAQVDSGVGMTFGAAGAVGEASASYPPILDIVPDGSAVSGYVWNDHRVNNPINMMRSCLNYREQIEGTTIFTQHYTYGRDHICYDPISQRLATLRNSADCATSKPCLDTDHDQAELLFKQMIQSNPEMVWLIGSKPELIDEGGLVDEITIQDDNGMNTTIPIGGAAAYADFYAYIYRVADDALQEANLTADMPRLSFCQVQIFSVSDSEADGLAYCQEAYDALQNALNAQGIAMNAADSIYTLGASQFMFREPDEIYTIQTGTDTVNLTGPEMLDATILPYAVEQHWIEHLQAFECWAGSVDSCLDVGLDTSDAVLELATVPRWLTAFGAFKAWCHELHDPASFLQDGGHYCEETGRGHAYIGRNQHEGLWGLMDIQIEYLVESEEWSSAWWYLSHSGEVESETTQCTAAGTLWHFEETGGMQRCSDGGIWNDPANWSPILSPMGKIYRDKLDCLFGGQCDNPFIDFTEPNDCNSPVMLEVDGLPEVYDLTSDSAFGDIDWFEVDLLEDETYRVIVTNVGQDADVTTSVGALCGTNDGGFSPTNFGSASTINPPQDGTFLVEVFHNQFSHGPDTAYAIKIELIDVNTPVDTDGDGLPDDIEINGYDIDKDGIIDIDLPAMGANPFHKDIFIEIDYMQDEFTSYHPADEAISLIVNSFNNAPVTNPDGSTGIHLHVDYGPNSALTWGAADTWGDLSEANALPYDDFMGECSPKFNWRNFDREIKWDNFNWEREAIFHYNVWGHLLCDSDLVTIGLSRNNDNSFAEGASDFLVLPGWFDAFDVFDTFDEATKAKYTAGIFMHELGHNLGLMHGGDDQINDKPNYMSIMNYQFSLAGLNRNGTWGHFYYSRYENPSLDENNLNETAGLAYDQWTIEKTFSSCNGAPTLQSTSSSIDWNCDGDTNDVNVVHDINDDNRLDLLRTQNDWNNLVYTGGLVGKFSLDSNNNSFVFGTLLPSASAPEVGLPYVLIENTDGSTEFVDLGISSPQITITPTPQPTVTPDITATPPSVYPVPLTVSLVENTTGDVARPFVLILMYSLILTLVVLCGMTINRRKQP